MTQPLPGPGPGVPPPAAAHGRILPTVSRIGSPAVRHRGAGAGPGSGANNLTAYFETFRDGGSVLMIVCGCKGRSTQYHGVGGCNQPHIHAGRPAWC